MSALKLPLPSPASLQVNTTELASAMSQNYAEFCFAVGQPCVVTASKSTKHKLQLRVKSLSALSPDGKSVDAKLGISYANTVFVFNNTASNSASILLTGDAVGYAGLKIFSS